LIDIWDNNKYDYLEYINNIFGINCKELILVVELSSKIFNNKTYILLVLSLLLLVSEFNNRIYINENKLRLLDLSKSVSIINKIDIITKNCGPSRKINLDKINILSKGNILIISTQKLLTKDNIKILHLKEDNNTMIEIDNKQVKLNLTINKLNINKSIIENLVKQLEDNNNIQKILCYFLIYYNILVELISISFGRFNLTNHK